MADQRLATLAYEYVIECGEAFELAPGRSKKADLRPGETAQDWLDRMRRWLAVAASRYPRFSIYARRMVECFPLSERVFVNGVLGSTDGNLPKAIEELQRNGIACTAELLCELSDLRIAALKERREVQADMKKERES